MPTSSPRLAIPLPDGTDTVSRAAVLAILNAIDSGVALQSLVNQLELEGLFATAKVAPDDDKVAVSAGRFRIGGSLINFAGGDSLAFAAPHATIDRVDLLYLTDAGALAIERAYFLDAAASALATTQEFKIDSAHGDLTAIFLEGQKFTVSGASANNGTHTIKDRRFAGGFTFIRTVGALVNSTGGQIEARYDGKMVIAAVTIQSGGATVINDVDIEDARAWTNNPAFGGDDAEFGGSKIFDRLQKFAAGVALAMGGAPYRVRFGAGHIEGGANDVVFLDIGINCDPNSLITGPILAGANTDPVNGYPRGVFDDTLPVLLIHFDVGESFGDNAEIVIDYASSASWTDGNDITLTQIAVLGLNGGVWTWSVYDGTALRALVKSLGTVTDNAIARFDGTTGGVIQNSAVTINDVGAIIIPATGSITITGGISITLNDITGGAGGTLSLTSGAARDILLSSGDEIFLEVASSSKIIYIRNAADPTYRFNFSPGGSGVDQKFSIIENGSEKFSIRNDLTAPVYVIEIVAAESLRITADKSIVITNEGGTAGADISILSNDDVSISAGNTSKTWVFGNDGHILFPDGGGKVNGNEGDLWYDNAGGRFIYHDGTDYRQLQSTAI